MKLYLTFKTPDVLEDAASEQASRIRDEAGEENQLDPDELQDVYDKAFEKLMEVGKKWVRDGEYISVEIDVDGGECIVKPV